MNRRAFKLQTVTFFALLTFASTTVMLADLYSPGPNTTDLQGQWINATLSPPPPGPPVYGTPGPADDVDLEGIDITASGGSVRSIYNVGSVSVTGMVSAVEASEFTLRGSGTLNVDHVRPNAGLGVVGGHLKATGAGDFVDVSGGGSVTAATCRGGSFRDASSLTLTGTGGSANFRSGSSLTAMAGLQNFTLTLSSASLAHIASYNSSTSGSVYINDAGSVLTVDQTYSINSGNLAITLGGAANIQGPMLLSGGLVSVDGSGSKLNAILNMQVNGGDLQMSNGGIGTVPELKLLHGEVSVRDSSSALKVDRFTIGSDPKNTAATAAPAATPTPSVPPATVHVDNGGRIQRAGGAESKITVSDSGTLNVLDSSGGNSSAVSAGELLITGGTVNLSSSSRVDVTVAQIEKGTQLGSLTISSLAALDTKTVFVRGGSTVDINDGSLYTDLLSLTGQLSISGASVQSFVVSKEVTVSNPSTLPGSQLHAHDGGTIQIDSLLRVFSGVVSVISKGKINVGVSQNLANVGEIRVHLGGWLIDDGAVNGIVINLGGTISGTGRINGGIISGGRVGSGNSFGALTVQAGPGTSPGVLTVQGDFTQNSNGLLAIEVGGTDAGTGYNQLQVSGATSITGNLQVRLVNGFTPAVGQTYRIVNAGSFSGGFSSITQPSQAGISVSNDAGGVTVTITSVVAGAPVISSATAVTATQGEAFSYQIAATNNPTTFGAMNLPAGLTVDHATGVISGTPTVAGNYIVPMAANNDAGSGQADLIIHVGSPSVTIPSQLLNISTRMRVLTGDNVLIGGFIVTGTEPKRVIIRGIGPSLGALGLSGVLADPTLELHQPNGTVITNDNWKVNAQTGQSQEADIRATTIVPTDDLESAIVATLPPGNYSAVLAGKNQTSGIGVVEVYDLGQTANSQLANISSRGFVDTSDNVMIGGFIVSGGTGSSNSSVIVRALGPSVPVAGALGDPTLELHNASGTIVTSNDNWKTRPDGSSQQAEIEATMIQPTNDLDSAVVASLPAGNYTAVVRGKNNTTGIGLVEVYKLQ